MYKVSYVFCGVVENLYLFQKFFSINVIPVFQQIYCSRFFSQFSFPKSFEIHLMPVYEETFYHD